MSWFLSIGCRQNRTYRGKMPTKPAADPRLAPVSFAGAGSRSEAIAGSVGRSLPFEGLLIRW